MIQDSEVSVLLAAIGAADPCERGRAADEVADIHRALGAEQAARVASELVVARLHETVPECQEVQLNALGDLKAWHMIPKQLLLSLAPLQSESLGAQKEYLVPRHRGFDRLNLCRPALALFTDDVYLHLSLRPAPRTCPRGSGASAGLNSQVQVPDEGVSAFEGSYGFTFAGAVDGDDVTINVIFDEGNFVQDETGSLDCTTTLSAESPVFCQEPIEIDKKLGTDVETQETVHAMDFSCEVVQPAAASAS